MNNSDCIEFFEEIGQNIQDPNEVKLCQGNDFSIIDADFIAARATRESRVLDLGSGTGLVISKLLGRVNSITAVEPVKKFTDFIKPHPAIEIINAGILSFKTDKSYDLVTLFGVLQYFNREESNEVYSRCLTYLRPGGKIIIKNQFGIREDVTVEGYSKELGKDYFSQYRHIDGEQSLLRSLGYRNIEVFDIYPPECNRWDNTHFYAIVACR